MDTENFKRQLGNRLKLLRTAKGMRQEDLEDLGFSYRYYGRLERGLVNPTLGREKEMEIQNGLELRLYVHQQNEKAIRAYEKTGFEKSPYQIMVRKNEH